jgi:hypothetical protein
MADFFLHILILWTRYRHLQLGQTTITIIVITTFVRVNTDAVA